MIPSKIDRIIMWTIRSIPKINKIVQKGLGEAYDLGFNRGIVEGSKIAGSKKYVKKIKKVLERKYGTKGLT
tara:strand:+ start:73 stop:285 length:213 start_codon:yes stop_codon:yes gene_type:complete